MTTIVLVRHGQTAWNRVERFRGQADVPLDEVGLAQAARTAATIAARWKPAAVYASPLSRTMDTAAAIAGRSGLAAQPHPGLLDINFGEWQGMTSAEAAERWPEEVAAWFSRPDLCQIPGGEMLDRVRERGMAAVTELTTRHAGESFVLVGHSVSNRVLLLAMMGLGLDRLWRLHQSPCAINVIDYEEGEFILAAFNDTCHLFP